jgi:hypothetical protein
VTSPIAEESTFNGSILSSFRPMTLPEVRKILNNMSKSCQLDPVPIWLTKECIDEFLPIITDIINSSLKLGHVPTNLKHAIIKPLLKKVGLELTKNNYRPVSNLPFLGKALEAAVILQLDEHLAKNKLEDEKQSAYKKYHSTETLLLKVHNDIMTSLDNDEIVMLVMLDLSAAFDTIDHKILIDRLNKKYGIRDTALKWFDSYLSDRTQSVLINDKESTKKKLKYGVPQGSKLGPVLFNAYITPLSKIAEANNVIDQKYADDEQLILSFKPKCKTAEKDALTTMEKCIDEIRIFLKDNKLCNNSDKTELMLIGSKRNLHLLDKKQLNINGLSIQASDKVKNLGVLFDKEMTMDTQVSSMCKKAFYNIKNIARIRRSMSKEDTKTAVHALVTPHLDYGNALLYGIRKKNLNKLQVAQNSAARLIERLRKYDRISHIRKELHWLPIDARIDFKVLNMTWKALNDKSPKYIADLLTRTTHQRSLRSNNQHLLTVPRCRSNYGDRAFSYVGPKLWNDLPINIRNADSNDIFRSRLKTHLYHKHYGGT